MSFNNYTFLLLFLPLTLFIYYSKIFKLNKILILIISSFIFYSLWNFKHLFLLIFIILLNFFFGQLLIKKKSKKLLFFFIFVNLLLLLLFKYSNFFISNYNYFSEKNFSEFKYFFPLGISFITFHNIIFLIDCFENNIKNYCLKKYTLFISFFPQIIAGPITRYTFMEPQFSSKKKLSYKLMSAGIFLISVGLFKKTIIADNLILYIDGHHLGDNKNLDFLLSWLKIIAYTLYFYFDFSGYTDIARGIALLFGIKLPINFNSPLKSKSISEFWQRWHISLTLFLNNYIYIPLLKKIKRTNIFIVSFVTLVTFLIAGFWHGPSWNFIIFGVWHGFLIVINQIFKLYKFQIFDWIKYVLTFICINVGFIFFKYENLNDILEVLKKILYLNSSFDINYFINFVTSEIKFSLLFVLSIIIIFLKKNSNYYFDHLEKKIIFFLFVIISIMLTIFQMGNNNNEFIYFKF